MKMHEVSVPPAGQRLPRDAQLAWKLAEVATGRAPLDADVADMVACRIIDNTAVAVAAINREPVANARAQALAHPRDGGATVIGINSNQRFDCGWAAWANATAVRELDFHDSFFARDSSHPGDTIMPLLAVAQRCGKSGHELVAAIATAYEVQVSLVKGIELSTYRIDHVAHLGPAVTAGLARLMGLDVATAYQAIQLSAYLSGFTRQVRKGDISSWKANAPGFVGKVAIEAVDRAMRGETSPSPVYEGDYGILAILLGGPDAVYEVPLPEDGEPHRAILETYPKEHSAGYHGQALIDLGIRLHGRIADYDAVESVTIHTKRLTHMVMGSGAGDPEKWDPEASRETLDHSAMFIFTIALQDGTWHHETSYLPQRRRRADTERLWRKVQTAEDPEWNRRFDDALPLDKHHGARVVIEFADGSALIEEIAVADAHPKGARPFGIDDYVGKFRTLSAGILSERETDRFLSLVRRTADLDHAALAGLTPVVDARLLRYDRRDGRGIF